MTDAHLGPLQAHMGLSPSRLQEPRRNEWMPPFLAFATRSARSVQTQHVAWKISPGVREPRPVKGHLYT